MVTSIFLHKLLFYLLKNLSHGSFHILQSLSLTKIFSDVRFRHRADTIGTRDESKTRCIKAGIIPKSGIIRVKSKNMV